MKATTESTKKSASRAKAVQMNGATPSEKVAKAMNLMTDAKNQKIEQTKSQIDETYQSTLERAQSLLDDAKSKMSESQERLAEGYERAKDSTEEKIKEQPFRYLLGAGVIGMILGFLFSSRSRR